LDRVLFENRNVLPKEAREAADIILHAVRAEVGKIDKSSVFKHIEDYETTSLISELIKMVVLTELRGEYDNRLDEAQKKISNNMERKLQYFKSLLEDPEYRDVVEHFSIDLDADLLTSEPKNTLYIHNYFIRRARESLAKFLMRAG